MKDYLGLLAAFLIAPTFGTAGFVSTHAADLKPNIVFILTDDKCKDALCERPKPTQKTRKSPVWRILRIADNRLKFSPYIKDGMVVGGKERDFLFAIINIDFDNVGRWAEKNGHPYTTFVDLSQKEEVYDLVLEDVERVNRDLPQGARVKRFSLLHKEFDPDEGELTKTRKLRRAFLDKKFKHMIEAAYANQPYVTTEADVKYRDGRTATVKTKISIRDAK